MNPTRVAPRAVATLGVGALLATLAWPLAAHAQGSQSVSCVLTNPTTCVAKIPLVANMDVDITFSFPPNNGWSANIFNGVGPADWTSLNGGYWTGTGSSLTANLQTPSSEPANAEADVTFGITPLTAVTTTTVVTKKKLPAPVAITFAATSRTLSPTDKALLNTLAKKLRLNSRVTYTGYAKANPGLARNRALVVANYLYARVQVFTTVVTVTATSLNEVRVVTTAL